MSHEPSCAASSSDYAIDEVLARHSSACWLERRMKSFKMPWDNKLTTMHDSYVARERKRLAVCGPLGPASVAVTAPEKSQGLGAVHSAFSVAGLKFGRQSDEVVWQAQLSAERKAGFKKWLSMILAAPLAWQVTRDVTAGGRQLQLGYMLGESVRETLAGKATSTIHARAGPLLRFWAHCRKAGIEAWPVQEHAIYLYMKAEKSAAPSAFRSLMLSISFAFHLFGLAGAEQVLGSGRIRGLAESHYAERRKVVQRPPLTVDQLKLLEGIVVDGARAMVDRIAAGFFLTLVYGRLRYSDGLSVTNLVLDLHEDGGLVRGYMEGQAERCKTSVTLQKKVRFLPVVIPLKSVGSSNWPIKWLELRAQEGLRCGEGTPLLGTPIRGGRWLPKPLSVGLAGDWLRSLLGENAGPAEGVRVATHSCKCTTLSMLAKFGADHGTRRLLGYHSAGKDKSMLVYSRDAMASPVRKLEDMIQAVIEGRFVPDCTRSGYFPGDDARALQASVDAGSDLSGSSSAGSDDDEAADPAGEESAAEEVVGDWGPELKDDLEYYRHRVSRYIHIVADEAGAEFLCGRRVAQSYEALDRKPRFMHPTCPLCFKKAAVV